LLDFCARRADAASGGTWGNGRYGTAYARRAISEDVALTDNAFAVFVRQPTS
jgi:hypothetical protein